MGISASYLMHLVTIDEPQAIYHPRLPAPFPSNVHGAQDRPMPGSTGSAVSPASSVTPGALRSFDSSGSPGSPRTGLVDVQA